MDQFHGRAILKSAAIENQRLGAPSGVGNAVNNRAVRTQHLDLGIHATERVAVAHDRLLGLNLKCQLASIKVEVACCGNAVLIDLDKASRHRGKRMATVDLACGDGLGELPTQELRNFRIARGHRKHLAQKCQRVRREVCRLDVRTGGLSECLQQSCRLDEGFCYMEGARIADCRQGQTVIVEEAD